MSDPEAGNQRDPRGLTGEQVDLNADVGESFGTWRLGDDEALMPLLTSANVACGFHAGDPGTIRATCELAREHGVAIGAQVSYPDLAGFGRRYMDVTPPQLRDDVTYQIGALTALAGAVGARVRYVKAHGALYHALSRSPEQAGALVQAVLDVDTSLTVVAFPGSVLMEACERAGLHVVGEGFADRRYREDGELADRREPRSVLTDPSDVAAQAAHLARTTGIRTVCLHGDTPGAPQLARAVRDRLTEEGITIRAFTRP